VAIRGPAAPPETQKLHRKRPFASLPCFFNALLAMRGLYWSHNLGGRVLGCTFITHNARMATCIPRTTPRGVHLSAVSWRGTHIPPGNLSRLCQSKDYASVVTKQTLLSGHLNDGHLGAEGFLCMR
jgi:hypothetical protein